MSLIRLFLTVLVVLKLRSERAGYSPGVIVPLGRL